MWKVLIFPGATELALEIRKSLMYCRHVELFSASSAVSSHAQFVFKNHSTVADVSHPNWLSELNELIATEGITHVMAAHDDALLALSENRDVLQAKLVTSPHDTCKIARSKGRTYEVLSRTVPMPVRFNHVQEPIQFPVFLKPDIGQGASRTSVARSQSELSALLAQDSDRDVWEFLNGPEYTVDCFTDRDKGLLFVSGRERRRIRTGIAMNAVRSAETRFVEYAEKISSILSFHGAWFYQAKSDSSGQLKVMEVAPRIGGTSALTRVCGVNLPLLSLYECERMPVKIVHSDVEVEIDRALTNRYSHNLEYDCIYVDFDDTLVTSNGVNTELVRFLYQCLNKGKRIELLTAHRGDIDAALRKWRLRELFDSIAHVKTGEAKSSHIHSRNALFIDDSFMEREKVRAATNAIVVDPCEIELFLDDKV